MFNACRSKRVRRGRGKLNRNLDRYATGAVGTLLIRYLDRSARGESIIGENRNTASSFRKSKLSNDILFFSFIALRVTFHFRAYFPNSGNKGRKHLDLNAARQTSSCSLALELYCERSLSLSLFVVGQFPLCREHFPTRTNQPRIGRVT